VTKIGAPPPTRMTKIGALPYYYSVWQKLEPPLDFYTPYTLLLNTP
jgi:hypothetical protein